MPASSDFWCRCFCRPRRPPPDPRVRLEARRRRHRGRGRQLLPQAAPAVVADSRDPHRRRGRRPHRSVRAQTGSWAPLAEGQSRGHRGRDARAGQARGDARRSRRIARRSLLDHRGGSRPARAACRKGHGRRGLRTPRARPSGTASIERSAEQRLTPAFPAPARLARVPRPLRAYANEVVASHPDAHARSTACWWRGSRFGALGRVRGPELGSWSS